MCRQECDVSCECCNKIDGACMPCSQKRVNSMFFLCFLIIEKIILHTVLKWNP
jgi:hypothetical protein